MPRARKTLSHIAHDGSVRMVDVTTKPDQVRTASAVGTLVCRPGTIQKLKKDALPKGDALATAQIAGIQAAKQTASLIPLCHPLPLHKIDVAFSVKRDRIEIVATAKTTGKTGVEMEALTAVSVVALTLYDMLKAVDTTMRIEGISVMEKLKETP